MRRKHFVTGKRRISIVTRQRKRGVDRRSSRLGTDGEVHERMTRRPCGTTCSRDSCLSRVPKRMYAGAKRRHRSAGLLDCDDSVRRPKRHEVVIARAAKSILLPVVRDISPDDSRRRLNGEAPEPGVVLVRDRAARRRYDEFLANEVDPAVDRELQATGNSPASTPGNSTSRRAPFVMRAGPRPARTRVYHDDRTLRQSEVRESADGRSQARERQDVRSDHQPHRKTRR